MRQRRSWSALAATVTLAGGQLAITGVTGTPGESAALPFASPMPKQCNASRSMASRKSSRGQIRRSAWTCSLRGRSMCANSTPGPRPTAGALIFPTMRLSRTQARRPPSTCSRRSGNCWTRPSRRTSPRWVRKLPIGRNRRARRNPSYSYHNFICERPERLWLIIPFLSRPIRRDAQRREGRPLRWDAPSCSAFVDMTDRVNYGEENRLVLAMGGLGPNHFMGPFLL